VTEEQYKKLVAEDRRRVFEHAVFGRSYIRAADDDDFLRSIGVDPEQLRAVAATGDDDDDR